MGSEPESRPDQIISYHITPAHLQVVIVAGEVGPVHVEQLRAVVVAHVLKVDERRVAVAAAHGGQELVKQLRVLCVARCVELCGFYNSREVMILGVCALPPSAAGATQDTN